MDARLHKLSRQQKKNGAQDDEQNNCWIKAMLPLLATFERIP